MEAPIYVPNDSVEDYQEHLDEVLNAISYLSCEVITFLQVKKGKMSGKEEDPYETPSSNEAAIFECFKKLKIRTIAGFSVE